MRNLNVKGHQKKEAPQRRRGKEGGDIFKPGQQQAHPKEKVREIHSARDVHPKAVGWGEGKKVAFSAGEWDDKFKMEQLKEGEGREGKWGKIKKVRQGKSLTVRKKRCVTEVPRWRGGKYRINPQNLGCVGSRIIWVHKKAKFGESHNHGNESWLGNSVAIKVEWGQKNNTRPKKKAGKSPPKRWRGW